MPTPLQLRFREVHERIKHDFDDRSAWLVYADLLLQKGDPRGEIVSAAHLPQGNVSDLVAKYGATMFGKYLDEVQGEGPFQLRWQHGVVAGVTVKMPRKGRAEHRHQHRAFMERLTNLLRLPVCQFVRSFKYSFIGYDGHLDGLFDGILDPAAVRELEIEALSDTFERSSRGLEWDYDLNKLAGLETLSLECRTTTLQTAMGALNLPALRKLELNNDNFYSPDIDALAASALPALESLKIMPISKQSYLDTDELARFVQGKGMPKLRKLMLSCCRFTDNVIDALIGSPMLARLTELQLTACDYDRERLKRPELAHLAIKT
ncbi:MAG: hypothetical protein QM831_39660 [Kofleriaceae bacterium]